MKSSAPPLLAAVALAAALTACAGDGLEAPVTGDTAALAGSFVATRAVVVNPDDPTQQFDLVRAGGAYTLTVDDGGAFQRQVTLPGGSPVVSTGTMTVDPSGSLLITEDDLEDERLVTYVMQGDRLRIVDTRTPRGLLQESTVGPAILTLDLQRR